MNKIEISNRIVKIVNDYFRTEGIAIEANEQTILFGSDSVIDSMGLVYVIVQVEGQFLDEGFILSLMSDIAMSKRRSPFKTISTLTEFIEEQLKLNNYGK
jgi:acyl carrier protein